MKYRYIIICAALVACAAAGCSGEGRLANAARGYGEADARTFIENVNGMTLMETESYLLNIRANEYTYREEGHPVCADAYISGFSDYILQHSDSLSSLLGITKPE